MILLISTCKEKLSEEEFVIPIADMVKKEFEIKHYKEEIEYGKYEKIILCGTALIDDGYLNDINCFEFLKATKADILGICSGMQIIGLIFNAKLDKSKEIGMTTVKTLKKNPFFKGEFESYALHGNSLKDLADFYVLAISKDCVQAIKHKTRPIYGVMFHPEIRNQEIISNFLNL